ncbi:hypothetical protein vBBcePLY3_00023 [Bacillus phage vB_BceP_LY3]|uniref:Uncharacterized protein n=1 Tax=Bacillus phage vB_BceP_LY3 TaxID=2950458 RepID=A0AAE9LV54_9CAUD|nr:hypothetical protein vBBcePLY3_00023 [Bacillus phage vB_BceP_LY3]
MEREEKLKHLIELIEFVEGVKIEFNYFDEWSIEKIDNKIEFYEYVAEK